MSATSDPCTEAEYEDFPEAELRAAAEDVSDEYRGKVLAKVLLAVRDKHRLQTRELAAALHLSSCRSVYMRLRGTPCTGFVFERDLTLLAAFLLEHHALSTPLAR